MMNLNDEITLFARYPNVYVLQKKITIHIHRCLHEN